VEGLQEAEEEAAAAVVAVVVPLGVLLDAHRAALAVRARQVVHQAVPVPEALLRPVADLAVPHELARLLDSPDQMGYPPSLTVLVQVRALVFWGVLVGVGFVGLSLVDIAGGAVATMGQPPVEASPLTRWSQPWQKGRNRGPVVVVSPNGSMFVGLAGG
jgi:hypothetical protein